MGIVLKGGKILDRKGERSLDVSIGSDGKILETGKKLNGDVERPRNSELQEHKKNPTSPFERSFADPAVSAEIIV